METAMSGSVSEQVRMGLFDNMDSEVLPGSRLESFAELLHRHVTQSSSSGYIADVSASFKSDSASLRMSRFSIASNFDTAAPIACSSMLSRASLEPPALSGSSEFAVPRHPIGRQPKSTRPTNGEAASQIHSPNAQSKQVHSNPSNPALYPDSTECSSVLDPEVKEAEGATAPAAQIEAHVTGTGTDQGSIGFTALKVGRKRGRKPKIPEMIKESDSSCDTPTKKGRRGRPPSSDTLAKNRAGSKKSDQQSETTPTERNETNADQQRPSTSSNDPSSHLQGDSASDKSSEDYLKEAEEAWRDSRTRSFEIGHLNRIGYLMDGTIVVESCF